MLTARRLTAVAIAICCTAGQTQTFDFDADIKGWKFYKDAAQHVALDTTVKHAGVGAVRLDDTSEWAYVGMSRVVPAKPNTKYRVSAWVKTEHTNGATCVFVTELPHKSGRFLKFHVLLIEQPRDWRRVEKELTTNANTGRIKIELCPVGFGMVHTGTAWFDDVELREAE